MEKDRADQMTSLADPLEPFYVGLNRLIGTGKKKEQPNERNRYPDPNEFVGRIRTIKDGTMVVAIPKRVADGLGLERNGAVGVTVRRVRIYYQVE